MMTKVKRRITRLACLAGAGWLAIISGASGQALPQLENGFRNVFSEAGEPDDPEPLEPGVRTGDQFGSGTVFGGWKTTRIVDGSDNVVAGSVNEGVGDPGVIKNPKYTPLAADSSEIPSQTIQLKSVKMGRSLVLRMVSFSLGSEIPRPDREPDGSPLDPGVFAEAEFYFKEPANSESGNFYWSPHAQKVFATQPGTITVDWEERVSGNLFTQTYTISGSPVQPARTIYWTERGFNGPLVAVPEARVSEVNVVYNHLFPKKVPAAPELGNQFVSFDYDPDDPYNPENPGLRFPPEERTLWHDELTDSIHAYNVEGRAFVELLGDLREPERIFREHLGFEIVEVVQEVRPDELRVSIGELVLPVDESQLTSEDDALVPDVAAGLGLNADPYLYEHVTLGGTKLSLYAIKETTPLRVIDRNDDDIIDGLDEQQSNEVLIYWKEEGVMRLLWPKKYVGYIFKWPEEYFADAASEAELRDLYSIYARPENSADAAATGIQLNSANNPVLTYQDDATHQHAQLTPQNIFYTVPGTGNHSLIRYSDGDSIWFERVYSQVNQDFDNYSSATAAVVGSRIDPPVGVTSTVGYIRQSSGDAFNPDAYIDPFVAGFEDAADGAIIPVNALPTNDGLEIWWYQQSAPPEGTTFAATWWPSNVSTYQLAWPVTDPDDANRYDEIVLARNDGSGDLGIAATGSVYRQPDPNLPGFNPNEEHALMSGGVAWAIRDDLNLSSSSEPFVLVDYTAADDRPAMVIRRVLRENATHTFTYEAPVGVILQAPMPLPVIPLPIDAAGNVKNVETADPTDKPATLDNQVGLAHYEHFTYVDRKGSTWIYRGANGAGVNVGSVNDPSKHFQMHYYYKTEAEFDFPGLPVPDVGTIMPYLRPSNGSGGFVGDPIDGDPLKVTFIPVWPQNPPVLGVAETLGLPKRGLPAVRGQVSARLLYEQSIAADLDQKTRSAVLFDPTRAKVYEFSESGLSAIPGSIATSDYLGKIYFPNLPPHLSERLFYDPNIGSLGALVFVGEFIDAPFGEDYYLLNVMSPKDVADIRGLVDSADVDKVKWENSIDGLQTTLETFIEDPGQRGVYIVDSSKDKSVGPSALAEIESDDTAVDSYAISAAGGGTGYVVLAAGDGEAFVPVASPVSLHVFKVSAPLYRGELKVVESANPLDEKLTLQHSGDFAGDPSDYEFAWITGQPVSGFPPSLYTFSGREVFPNGSTRTWTLLNNPAAGYESARNFAYDAGDWDVPGDLSANQITINDGGGSGENGVTLPNAVLRDTLTWAGSTPIDLYLSLEIADNDGAAIYLNGAEIAVWNVPGRENSVPTSAPGAISSETLSLVFAIAPESLQEQNTITVDLYTVSDVGFASTFDLRLDSQQETALLSAWQDVTAGAKSGDAEAAKVRHIIEGASLLTLTDNYFSMRYRALKDTPAALATGGDDENPGGWSRWMPPQLAEGWIKRALGGINPFEQRVTDLFSNAVNTDVSLLSQAGARWEGDIALNLANIDDFGLIEIYETILRRGKTLSISGAPPLNVPAANDALLLAAGYLNDLYLLVGNEAFADAANPTIAFDTEGGDFGEFNTALFAFKGQLASVLDEELTLLRGRDDNLQPGVQVSPVYNRLVWNFTNGINSGEAIYSLNYNIQDNNVDGAANATDAAEQFPQGHGDAYGHYLTALKVYYGLLSNPHFAWTPRIEAVSVLGQPVSVDFQDERKFATAAAALARTASQTLDLTYRKEFTADENSGWEHLRDGNVNSSTGVTRHWGTDEWACRAGQGAYFHWVTANSILPEEDSEHEGIEKVDRTTVPELDEVVAHAGAIQRTLENADSRLNPLGLAKGALSFDISPNEIDQGKTHYEQVFERAIGAMKNAVFAFDNAKRSTGFLRQQVNSVADQRAAIEAQEQAFENELIEIYGTSYPDDIGPGRTYAQGYAGPDLLHFGYVETPELFFDPSAASQEFEMPLDPAFADSNSAILNFGETVSFRLNEARGELVKPEDWTGTRAHPGGLQTAVSDLFAARSRVRRTMSDYALVQPRMEQLLGLYKTTLTARSEAAQLTEETQDEIKTVEGAIRAAQNTAMEFQNVVDATVAAGDAIAEAFPTSVGFSNDPSSLARSAQKIIGAVNATRSAIAAAREFADSLRLGANAEALQQDLETELVEIAWENENRQLVDELQATLTACLNERVEVDTALRQLDQALRDLQALKARGLAIQTERETFRKRAAAIIQGYRTRDLAFRVFRDEALEKYKTLFDLAARYSFLAARAYDYETGLLDSSGSSAAAAFFDGIVQSRALGVVDGDGNPQFTASTTGDPGLAGVLAQMHGDWSVAKTRLGFNNPDRYRTTLSLRQEKFRVIPGEDGDQAWADILAANRMDDLLDDPDVRRYCMQIASVDGLPVPGLVIPFETTIADGFNFFGRPLAGGDHTFSPTSFATKIRASGIAFDGYIGMDSPTSTGGALGDIGAETPPDPDLGFLDPEALSATPYIYLIPVGVDSMRSPPLGDTSTVRTWMVDDQAIPLPFNIGNTDFSTSPGFVSSDSLSEDPFTIRKHQAFRAVPSGTVFSSAPGFTNSRLIGRSAWNSKWKLVIPGKTLRANPEVGIQIFNETVKDIQLFLETYSYSGN